MRKFGPFRSIKLCAYTVVGTDSDRTGVSRPLQTMFPMLHPPAREWPRLRVWRPALLAENARRAKSAKRRQRREARDGHAYRHSRGATVSQRLGIHAAIGSEP